MKLSKRLIAVSEMVTCNNIVADVGTDHGYVPIYLLSKGIIQKAIAMDINNGPLLKAKENIKQYHYEDRIELRLSDGLKKMVPGEAQSIIIAGMGGELIIKILTEGEKVLSLADEVILSPHSELELVRKYLYQNNYQIIQEKMLIEEDKYYTILKCKHGTNNNYSKEDLKYGKYLIENKDEVLLKYLQKEKKKIQSIKLHLMQNDSCNVRKRLTEIDDELFLIESTICRMKNISDR